MTTNGGGDAVVLVVLISTIAVVMVAVVVGVVAIVVATGVRYYTISIIIMFILAMASPIGVYYILPVL